MCLLQSMRQEIQLPNGVFTIDFSHNFAWELYVSLALLFCIVRYVNSNKVQMQLPVILLYQDVKCCVTYCALQYI